VGWHGRAGLTTQDLALDLLDVQFPLAHVRLEGVSFM
jgi:hypothetical protein